MGEMSITLDCDVLNADGGTRCASITGAWVAPWLWRSVIWVKMNVLKTVPLIGQVAAVSCGIVKGEPVLDLDYDEDSSADADANFVLTNAGGLVEIQATAEKNSFSEEAFTRLLQLARTGYGGVVRGTAQGGGGLMGRKLSAGSKIVLASHNKGKLAELTDLLLPYRIEIVSAGALGLPEPEETAPDFAGNARIKALAATMATGLPAFS